jgi:hypothetical protein
MPRQIVRKQVTGVDHGPRKTAFARQVDRDLRSECPATHEDAPAAVGLGTPRHGGGKFAVKCEVHLGGLDLDRGALIDPAAKLATARALDENTAINSLGVTLGLGEVHVNELYATLDWLGRAQTSIEDALARRHLHDGTLVLYDVSSSYVEGGCCPLARFGHSRDHRSDRMQIVYGLLCAPDRCSVAIEVFAGNTGDPSTVGNQITKL